MKKTTGPGKGKPMMKDMKPAKKTVKMLALKKEVKPMSAQMVSKKTEVIKPKGIAKPSSVSKPKPLPARLNTQKMMQKSIEGGKELKATKKRNRRETAAMALGGLAATAGTILTDFRLKGNKKKL
jgi:hypothetical protein